MTGFVDAALNVSVQLQTTQRQYDMESSRSPHDKAPDRLLELQATVSLVTHSATLALYRTVRKEKSWQGSNNWNMYLCFFFVFLACTFFNVVCLFPNFSIIISSTEIMVYLIESGLNERKDSKFIGFVQTFECQCLS